ncbi:hypothetical protein B0H13DRAFT_2364051 [Mycena leptocephala]|nr:hypothetical protein B0H13DRAFT_2364051 [Mycena leptocephala]
MPVPGVDVESKISTREATESVPEEVLTLDPPPPFSAFHPIASCPSQWPNAPLLHVITDLITPSLPSSRFPSNSRLPIGLFGPHAAHTLVIPHVSPILPPAASLLYRYRPQRFVPSAALFLVGPPAARVLRCGIGFSVFVTKFSYSSTCVPPSLSHSTGPKSPRLLSPFSIPSPPGPQVLIALGTPADNKPTPIRPPEQPDRRQDPFQPLMPTPHAAFHLHCFLPERVDRPPPAPSISLSSMHLFTTFPQFGPSTPTLVRVAPPTPNAPSTHYPCYRLKCGSLFCSVTTG